MSSQQPGVIVRILRGFWNALNFTRRLVFNLIFLFLLIVFFAAVFASRPTLQPRTALVLDPKGMIVEQYSIDPMQRALGNLAGEQPRETQLRDLLHVIEIATKDSRIERIVLLPDDIAGAGLATLHELGNALDRFRAAGKEVIAVAGDMGQSQYLLAAHADKILLDPDGAVLIEGFASYRSYFKDALDKLGVQVHLIKVGQYKSAAEPYVLNQASEASKEADRYWMGGLWDDYLAEISGLRKIDATTISEDIAHYDERVAAHSGDLAKLALEQKLVDQLATRADARALLRSKGVADGSDSFRQVDFKTYLAMIAPQPMTVRLAGRRRRRAGRDRAGRTAAGNGRRPLDGAADPRRARRRSRQGAGAAHRFARRRCVFFRTDPPRSRADARSRQTRRCLDGRRRRERRLLDRDGRRGDLGRTDHDHGIDRHLRPVRDGARKPSRKSASIPTASAPRRSPARSTSAARCRRSSSRSSTASSSTATTNSSAASPRRASARRKKSTRSRKAACGAAARPRNADSSTSSADSAMRSLRRRRAPSSEPTISVRYVEHEPSTWERFLLSFGDSQAMVHFARSLGFSMPGSWLDRGEIAQIAGLRRIAARQTLWRVCALLLRVALKQTRTDPLSRFRERAGVRERLEAYR